MVRGRVFFWTVVVFYLSVISLVTFKDIKHKNMSYLKNIDSKLMVCTRALDNILGKDFHEIYNLEHPISDIEYKKVVKKLSSFAAETGVEYIYSIVQNKSDFYIVIINDTPENKKKKISYSFYTLFESHPVQLDKIFDKKEPVFCTYKGVYDSYRSVFVPVQSANGLKYILASEIKVANLDLVLRKHILTSFFGLILFFLPILPFFLLYKNISKRREKDLLQKVFYDQLTKLPNRNKFIQDSELVCQEDILAVLINIDSFKEINDLFGGDKGDELLRDIANIIVALLEPCDLIYKLPADEYLIFFRNKTIEEVINSTKNILNKISVAEFKTAGENISITVTAGITKETKDYRKILSTANIAKNMAKLENRSFKLYTKRFEQEKVFKENLFWLQELKKALHENRVVPFYQPIRNNDKKTIDKYEALVRIIKDDEIIPPAKFLVVAKKSKLYSDITKVVIEKSFQDFCFRKDLIISINFSVSDFLSQETMSYFKDMVCKYEMQNRVIIELVESESVKDYKKVIELVDDLKKMGVKIAIDDFGSGYSNLEYLLKIKADCMKIDGSIIKNITHDKNSKAIVKSLVSFANEMAIKLVAEFVSNESIQEEVENLGVHYSQGFYIGKPDFFPTKQ